MRLEDGSRVVVVGGGPAGSFSALQILQAGAEAGLSLEVVIVEPRNFELPGPGGCNKCAGILSANLIKNLDSLGLQLPPDVIQSEIATYVLHLNGVDLPIQRPDPNHRIFSVYRGSGPRLRQGAQVRSFDGWLLEEAQRRGARCVHSRVQAVQPGRRAVVITPQEEIHADLVLVATGVNARSPLDKSWGYQPPTTEIMAQDEVLRPESFANDSVSVFFDQPSGLFFGAVIPKGYYANISLLGHQMPEHAVQAFLEAHGLIDLFSQKVPGLCGCTPKVAVSMARNYFSDRMAAVGDASVTRLFKDGIGAAFITARAAARTAIQQGITRADFETGYAPVCRQIDQDNKYGKWLFKLWSITRHSPILMDTWRRGIQAENDLDPADQVHTRVLWGMFTGSESYRQLFWLSFSRKAFLGLWRGAWFNWRKH